MAGGRALLFIGSQNLGIRAILSAPPAVEVLIDLRRGASSIIPKRKPIVRLKSPCRCRRLVLNHFARARLTFNAEAVRNPLHRYAVALCCCFDGRARSTPGWRVIAPGRSLAKP